MTATRPDRTNIHCCDCGGHFYINGINSDCTNPTIRCPYCGRDGSFVKECRR